jgi:hypothetical protein
MSLHLAAQHLAQKGRGPDDTLVHMSKRELSSLQNLAKAHGGSLTQNPETGLPEAGFLDKLLPALIGAAGVAVLGPEALPWIAGGLGTATAAQSGDIGKGLVAGLGAYGGGNLAAGFMDPATIASASTEAAAKQAAQQGLTGEAYNQTIQNQVSGLADKISQQTPFERLGVGANAVSNTGSAAADFAKQNWKSIAAASLPVLMANETTTPMPSNQNAYIRPYTYDPYGQQYTALTPVKAEEWGSRQLPTAAKGGLMALAMGGMATGGPMMGQNNTLDFAEQSEPVVRMADGGETDPTQLPRSQITAPQLAAQESIVNNQQQGALNAVNQGIAAGLTPEQIASSINSTYGKNFGAQNILDFAAANNITLPTPKTVTPVNTALVTTPVTTTTDAGTNISTATNVPVGVGGGGNTYVNPNGTVTTEPNIPGRPEGGFTGVQQVKDVYTQGGGSLGYTPYTPQTYQELLDKFPNTGGSKQAYDYLMGKGSATVPVTPTGEIMKPYAESVMGMPTNIRSKKYLWNKSLNGGKGGYEYNPAYAPSSIVTQDERGLPVIASLDEKTNNYMGSNGKMYDVKGQLIAEKTSNPTSASTNQGNYAEGMSSGLAGGGQAVLNPLQSSLTSDIEKKHEIATKSGQTKLANQLGQELEYRKRMLARQQNNSDQNYNLGGYSDGGRLLRGPGDGVSDDIPATIGGRQPARLADGEFVVPARIVSELGNGSTEAGARKLYAMMDRIQHGRKKSIGKGKVAVNSRADKHLPA